MSIVARRAAADDIPELVTLYESLAAEMVALKPVWAVTDGLPEPAAQAFAGRLDSDWVYIGEIDSTPAGFLVAAETPVLPQAGEARLATIEFLFTMPEARRVGVAEAMMDRFLEEAAAAGVSLFDALVSPGHRQAKNFFESNGFKARRIVMHRGDQ